LVVNVFIFHQLKLILDFAPLGHLLTLLFHQIKSSIKTLYIVVIIVIILGLNSIRSHLRSFKNASLLINVMINFHVYLKFFFITSRTLKVPNAD